MCDSQSDNSFVHLSYIFLGLQGLVAHLGLTYYPVNSFLPSLCLVNDDPISPYFIKLSLLASAFMTALHSLSGFKLPVLVAPSHLFLSVAKLALQAQCPTHGDLISMGVAGRIVEYMEKVNDIRGSLLIAGTFHVILASTGAFTFLYKRMSRTTCYSVLIAGALSVLFDLKSRFSVLAFMGFSFAFIVIAYLRDINVSITSPLAFIKKFSFAMRYSVLITFVLMYTAYLAFFFTKDAYYSSLQSPLNTAWFPSPASFMSLPTFHLPMLHILLLAITLQSLVTLATFKATALMTGQEVNDSSITCGLALEGGSAILSSIFGLPMVLTPTPSMIGLISITETRSSIVSLSIACWTFILAIFHKSLMLFILLPIQVYDWFGLILYAALVVAALSEMETVKKNNPAIPDASNVILPLDSTRNVLEER